jgi:hypothetical protein
MNPFINHEVTLAREADQRRRAERDRRVNAVVSRPPRRLTRPRLPQWRLPRLRHRLRLPQLRLGRLRLDRLRLDRLRLDRFLRGVIRFEKARRTEMAKFMDVHSGFTGVTEEQLQEAHQRDLDNEAAEGVHFERAWLDPESGVVFCLSSGPSREAVRRVHEKAGHPADEIYELPVEVV